MPRPLKFLTLGPAGTNHELVTWQYLSLHGLIAEVVLIDDFFDGLARLKGGEADYMVQAAVHRDCTDVVARGHFEFGVRVVDTFIAPSKELAILTRTDVETPRRLALQPATSAYADLTAWPEKLRMGSIMEVAESLLEGRCDSGLTVANLAQAHPDRFRVETHIGTVDDPWIVLAHAKNPEAGLTSWPDSPAVQAMQRRMNGG